MENKNYILITIKLLDIYPLIDNLITYSQNENKNEELLIIFQGNNTFFDLGKLIKAKEEILIKINKNKKTIIISLVKSDILLSSTIFNIKKGEHWIVFNHEIYKNKSLLTNQIKIKLFCNIKEENSLIKRNISSKEKENTKGEQNIDNDNSSLNTEKINTDKNNNSYGNEHKSSLINIPNMPNKQNKKYPFILTENNSPNLGKEHKIISKLNRITIKKAKSNFSFNKNKINKKAELPLKGNKKIFSSILNKNDKNDDIINDEYILNTIEGIKPNKNFKAVSKNSKDKNVNLNKKEDKNKLNDYNNLLYKDYLFSKIKNINIKTPINTNKKHLNGSPFTSKAYRNNTNNINKTKKNTDNDKDIYINQELKLLLQSKKTKNNNLDKENENVIDNQNSEFSYEIFYKEENEDSFELNKFDELKEDFLLLYNGEYNNGIKNEFLKLEIDLFIEKMIELMKTFHTNITEKLQENKILENKYKSQIDKYFVIKKLYSKLQQLKNCQNIQINKKENLIKSNNLLNSNEINIFKFILSNNYDFNKTIKLKNILNIILNKKENKKLMNEEMIKKLEKYNILKEKENNDISLSNDINNNSLNTDSVIYKRKKAISHPLKNKIDNSIKN